MRVLKVLANVLLNCLLFICLTVLGLGIALNATILSSRFVNHQIDKLDVAGLVNDPLIPELEENPELSKYPEFISSIRTTITRHEAEMKQAVGVVVTDVYGYVINGHQLDLTATLKKSLLDPRLAQGVIADLDLSPVVEGLAPQVLPDELSFSFLGAQYKIDLTTYLNKLTPVIQPWFKQQVSSSIPNVFNYLLGETASTDVKFSFEGLKNDIYPVLKQAFLDSPPPQVAGLSRDMVASLFDTGWVIYSPQMPIALDLNLGDMLGLPGGIPRVLSEVQPGLVQAREYVGYFQTGFLIFAGMTLLLILIVILINRSIKDNCRALGLTLTAYGVLELAGTLAAFMTLHSDAIGWDVVPASLQPWVFQLGDSVIKVMLIFPAFCAVTGIAMLVISFTYQRQQA